MKVRHAILGLLMEEARSGYEIKQYFENRLAYFYDPSYGTIYPTLKILEQDGFLSKTTVTQEGKPNKNVYTITDTGIQEFLDCLKSPYEPDVVRSDVLMRLFFGTYVDNSQIMEWVEDTRLQADHNVKNLLKIKELYGYRMPFPQLLSLDYGIALNRSKLEIAESFMIRLHERESQS
ncbi:DNA-binding PadR family transcriptional regulator [Paenibacillus shirakamiensis]|uniref:DNA-binding PadR family transcriptional regulator n=1 Tax=Paenibacillus shirakamiensis TaxID=1265935 RepID=A0ABS4JJM5_9BACL|nr:PadR family transcriptional regulator [Paenibacillus shirakamiensis]MBP2001888.1 DNA-binding PadR family transcriptional regulator [Paenibacillus shirakamiensis]